MLTGAEEGEAATAAQLIRLDNVPLKLDGGLVLYALSWYLRLGLDATPPTIGRGLVSVDLPCVGIYFQLIPD